MSSDEDIIIQGGCYCGAVRYQTQGRPIRAAYCHCTLCQRLNAAAFIHTIHWKAGQVSWTHSDNPEEALQTYSPATVKPWKKRFRCKTCGVCIAGYSTKTNKWSTWGAQADRDENGKIKDWDIIKPTHHIFYDTRMLDVNDGLPKWKTYENESERLD